MAAVARTGTNMATKKTTKKKTTKKTTKKKATTRSKAAATETEQATPAAQVDLEDVARAAAKITAEPPLEAGDDVTEDAPKKSTTRKKAVKKKAVKKKTTAKKKTVKKKTVKKKTVKKTTTRRKTAAKKADADEEPAPTSAAPTGLEDGDASESTTPDAVAADESDSAGAGTAKSRRSRKAKSARASADTVERPSIESAIDALDPGQEASGNRHDLAQEASDGEPSENARTSAVSAPEERTRRDADSDQEAQGDKKRRRRRRPSARSTDRNDSAKADKPSDQTPDQGKTAQTAPDHDVAEEGRDGDRKERRSRRRRGGKRARRAEERRRESEQADPDGKDADKVDTGQQQSSGTREMLINVSAGDECRIAVLSEGRLEELFMERSSSLSHVGNIYKGRVTNVEASIQAVFVDFGLPKNGFLHISDVQPQYFPDHKGEGEDVGRKIPRHARPPIQQCFRRGQEVIVQIIKEGVGTKGPTLTTYLSVPGRFLVMMPGMNKQGVSRKIEDEDERRKMRDVMRQLEFPPGLGFILRTAGLGRTKRELQSDLHYLLRLWKRLVERVKRQSAPAPVYQESDLVTRTIRDVYTGDFSRVIVDEAETAKKVREFLKIATPRANTPVDLYTEREPLFHRFHIEDEIERINSRHVPLPSGGSLVIDSTEALVAIDVNSGRFRSPEDAEETALQINLEAAEEIARQLRLRDLGGLIVCDFIDMRPEKNQRAVEKALREALKRHKERARTLKMSAFGLIELTRQRRGPSMKRNLYADCPHCKGTGLVKMSESVILDVMRSIQLATHHEHVYRIDITVAADVAFELLNRKRSLLHEIEQETGTLIRISGDASFTPGQMDCVCEDKRGSTVTIPALTRSERSNR